MLNQIINQFGSFTISVRTTPLITKQFPMIFKIVVTTIAFSFCLNAVAQINNTTYPDSIAPVGVIKDISDSALLDIVQRQTFRYFWHYANPVRGLARDRDNTVQGDYYWE